MVKLSYLNVRLRGMKQAEWPAEIDSILGQGLPKEHINPKLFYSIWVAEK